MNGKDFNSGTKSVNKNLKGTKKNAGQNVRKAKNKQLDLIQDLKMEIATELGITEQIINKGWHSLSPRDSGKIGGMLSQRLRKMGK